jgi:hypothetical protein
MAMSTGVLTGTELVLPEMVIVVPATMQLGAAMTEHVQGTEPAGKPKSAFRVMMIVNPVLYLERVLYETRRVVVEASRFDEQVTVEVAADCLWRGMTMALDDWDTAFNESVK